LTTRRARRGCWGKADREMHGARNHLIPLGASPWQREDEVASVRSRTAGVMMTLMRNRRTVDRKTRFVPREERTRAFIWDRSADHIRASSQTAALKGRIHGCTRTLCGNVRCTVGAVHTWAPSTHGRHPEMSAYLSAFGVKQTPDESWRCSWTPS